MKKTKNATVSE